ncbi:MAG TPA: DUF4010 domain-containing protein, partial [Thermoanaerobaculia bacterium]
GFVALGATIIVGNLAMLRLEKPDPGVTTEVAMLLMFGVGALTVSGFSTLAIAIGGGVAVLLQFKTELKGVAAKLGDDLVAIMRFALIALVILPALPNREYGPFNVLNPYEIWLMVVLIVGISLGGYIVYKFFGERAGVFLGGILGGIISSTATTVSYAKRTKRVPKGSRIGAIVIMIASTVLMARVLAETALVGPKLLPTATGPILAMLILQVIITAIAWFIGRSDDADAMPAQENPSELKPALIFAGLYAVVLIAVAAAKDHLGRQGLYTVALVSGLTDVDAITLSTARLVDGGRLDAATGWRLILVATLSNLVFKAATVAVLGSRALFLRILALFGAAFGGGVLILMFWPG